MTRPLILAGVIGRPIAHSKSPLIHNHWIRRHGLAGVYAPFGLEADAAAEWIRTFARFGVAGFNVTAPFKETAFDTVEIRTERAEAAGSVNLVYRDGDGRTIGDSTDGWGFLESLRAAASWRSAGRKVAMVGAGGAARAVAAALLSAGAAEIRLANRTQARAEAVAEQLAAISGAVSVAPWPIDPGFFDGADLWINGTTLGLGAAEGEASAWMLPACGPETVAVDMIYHPLETPFLKAAAAAGARPVDGLGMLLHQARPSFEAWFGLLPEADDAVRALALEAEGCLP